MNSDPLRQFCVAIGIAAGTLFLSTNAVAQKSSSPAHNEAPLVVEGVVRQIYTGADERDQLVEIEVQRSEARSSASPSTARYPAPAELLYVHIAWPGGDRNAAAQSDRLPRPGESIRAYLKPRAKGGWQEASKPWFGVISDGAADTSGGETTEGEVSTDPAGRPTPPSSLGLTLEQIRLENRTALRVSSVARGSPAHSAGLEVGDVLVAINEAEIRSPDELTALAALGEVFSLDVVDVNSGRIARIKVDPTSGDNQTNQDAASQEKPFTPTPQTVSLGMSAESVTLGTRSAIKVIRVEQGGLAAKAGLEPGDIVVAANGVPTTSVEQLLSALHKSGPTLDLTVRDSRTGRDTAVAVDLGTRTPAPQPGPTSAPVNSELGAVTELAFHDNDFAVKVTEVTPGGAAARAGLRSGAIIVAADDKPVLHPNDLIDLARKSRGTMKLTIIDPASGKKSNVEVKLKR